MESTDSSQPQQYTPVGTPLPKRRHKFYLSRWLTGLLNLWLIWIFLASKLWTPKGDFSHLYDGVQGAFHIPLIILLPALNVAALYVVLHRALYERRKFRVLLLIQGIIYNVAVWGLVYFLTNQADNSPQPSTEAVAGIMGVPLLLVISAAFGIGRKPSAVKLESKILPPTGNHTPSGEFGPNPVTGLAAGIWALRANWQAVAWGLGASTLIAITMFMLDPKNSLTLHRASTTPNFFWPLSLLLIGAAFAMTYYQLVIAVATARGQTIPPREAATRTLRLLPKLVLLDVLQFMAIGLGFLLFVVPGVILAFRFFLARVILIDQKTGPITALKFSSRLMKRNGMQVIGIWFLQLLVSLLVISASFLLFRPWGNWVATPISVLISVGIGVFLTQLYREIDKTKHAGFSRLRVHWLNIVFLFAWILLWLAGVVALVIFAMTHSHPATSTTRTACFEIKIPARFQVTKLSDCHLRAESKYVILEYIPVMDNATTLDKFVEDQRGTHYFDPARYHQLPGVFGQSDVTADSEEAREFSYTDTKTGGSVEGVFVHTTETFKVKGVQIRNFILVATAKTDSASSDWGDGMFTDQSMDIADTIVFPPFGSDEFKADMQQVYQDFSDQKFQQAADDAATAAAAADNNQAKAAAFSLVGEAQAEQQNDAASMTAFTEAFSLDPTNADALDALGNQAFDQNDYATAVRNANQVTAQDDTYADAYNLLAMCYDATGNSALAKKNIEKALALDPENDLYQKNAALILNKQKPGKDSTQLPQPPI